ncbi:hypothetical protein EI94DRAFT_1863312 [Lactarius quietus]|nr:hypothetical protein EI94DRAFT_1863312 [Lactarius quietus]
MTVPSSPSSASADSPNTPQTPVSPTAAIQTLTLPCSDQSSSPSPTNALSNPLSSNTLQAKRKPSRRANTAERRATHNAVERQRRETLNGRFLDLAALLPNLSQIRRPSKSAIVNSSIAHIHASRRHRAMASRELRLLKLESDAVRRELNEWRDRAHLPRVEEPVRSEAFAMVLSGEVEILTSIPGMEEEEDGEGLDNEDEIPIQASSAGIGRPISEEAEDVAVPPIKSAGNPFTHNALNHPGASQLAHILPRPSANSRPVIAQNNPNFSFENPAMTAFYDQQSHVPSQQYQMHFNAGHSQETEKPAAWDNQIFVNQQLQQQFANQHGLYTSPATSHGPSPVNPGQPFPPQGYYQPAPRQQHPAQHIYGSPVDSEDGSSVGSGLDDRRNSMSGSTYGSPQGVRHGSYEGPGVMTSGIRMTADAAMWNHDGMGALGPNLTNAPIAVGGGGNGGGFAMMM